MSSMEPGRNPPRYQREPRSYTGWIIGAVAALTFIAAIIYGMSDRSKTAGTPCPTPRRDKAARRRAGHRQVRPLPTANPSCDVPLAPPRGAFLWEDLHGYVSTLGTRKNI